MKIKHYYPGMNLSKGHNSIIWLHPWIDSVLLRWLFSLIYIKNHTNSDLSSLVYWIQVCMYVCLPVARVCVRGCVCMCVCVCVCVCVKLMKEGVCKPVSEWMCIIACLRVTVRLCLKWARRLAKVGPTFITTVWLSLCKKSHRRTIDLEIITNVQLWKTIR